MSFFQDARGAGRAGALAVFAMAAGLAAAPAPAMAQDIGAARQALVNARNDVETPLANATVRLRSPVCTGTLIAPRIVISAAHCGFYAGETGWRPDRWHSLEAAGRTIVVEFGPDSNDPREVINAEYVNITGNRDMLMLALERAPDPSIARPVQPLLYPPSEALRDPEGFWSRQTFRVAGWGSINPSFDPNDYDPAEYRKTLEAEFAGYECTGWQGSICTQDPRTGQAQTRFSDSGGPLYWRNPENGETYLIGVLQGFGALDRYHYLWSTFQLGWPGDQGNPPGAPIDVSQRQWISKAINRSFCGVLAGSVAEGARTRQLHLWWSSANGDNFTTSQPTWHGCAGDRRRGYGHGGAMGGMVYSPDFPQPSGTIPLYHWFSPERGDNFLTSNPAYDPDRRDSIPPDYRFSGLEGYIYSPDYGPRSGVTPLWSWWSAERGDNFATTQAQYDPDRRDNIPPDYGYYRLEGYLLNAN